MFKFEDLNMIYSFKNNNKNIYTLEVKMNKKIFNLNKLII